MPSYLINEGKLHVPTGWSDATTNILGEPVEDVAGSIRISVSRAKGAGKQLVRHATELTRDFDRAVPGYALLRQEEATIGGGPAVVASATFLDEGTPAYHVRATLEVGGTFLTVAVAGPEPRRDEIDALFASVSGSLVRREEKPS